MSGPSLSTKVDLVIAAKNLPSKDVFSKSDPMGVLFWWDNQKWVKIGHTEAINNNEHPVFTKRFTVDFFFEMTQKFKIVIYDVDSSNLDNLDAHDNIGHIEFTLGKLMCSPGNQIDMRMTKPTGELRSAANIIVTGYQVVESRNKAYVNVRGVKLDKLSFFGQDNTKLQLFRVNPDLSQHMVYESEVVRESQNPTYQPFKICLGMLTNGDVNKQFIIRVVRVKGDETELVGEARVSPNEVYRPSATMADPVKPVMLLRKDKGRGHLHFDLFNIVTENTFLDYVSAGLDFRLICAVGMYYASLMFLLSLCLFSPHLHYPHILHLLITLDLISPAQTSPAPTATPATAARCTTCTARHPARPQATSTWTPSAPSAPSSQTTLTRYASCTRHESY